MFLRLGNLGSRPFTQWVNITGMRVPENRTLGGWETDRVVDTTFTGKNTTCPERHPSGSPPPENSQNHRFLPNFRAPANGRCKTYQILSASRKRPAKMSENMGQSGIFTRNFAADCAFATRRCLARAPLQWNHRLPEAGKPKSRITIPLFG